MSEGNDANEDMNVEGEEGFSIDEAGVQRAIAAALGDVWSGLHDDDDVVGEDDGQEYEGGEGEDAMGEEAEGEDADHGWQTYAEWHDQENGLSALDALGEDFERDFISSGGFMRSWLSYPRVKHIYSSWKAQRSRHDNSTSVHL
jgi:hypothetical protein